MRIPTLFSRMFLLSRAGLRHAGVITLAGLALMAALPHGAAAQDARIAKLKANDRTSFTDAEIAKGFFLTAFGSEMQTSGRGDRIRKFVVPVRVHVDIAPKSGISDKRRAIIAAAVADIGARIKGIDIAMAAKPDEANVVVHLVKERDFPRAVDRYFGRENRKRIFKRLEPQCLSGFSKDAQFRIAHADVVLVDNVDTFTFYDCLYEELLQSLGPVNDTDKVSWTMFNDDVQKGFFDVYDQYILNLLYHPRMEAGMTAKQARALLPQIMPQVREWITQMHTLGGVRP